jgi:parvulin-like peptidyl-prolyl isomerase
MKHIRLVLILALVAAFAAACGGGGGSRAVPNDAVAVVGDSTISKADFDKVLDQAKRSYNAQHRAFPKAGTQQFSSLQAQIVQFLVERSEYDQEAKKMGVKVTDKEVTDRLDQVKQQYFVNPAGQKPATKAQIDKRYQDQLKAQGLTDKDVRDGIRSQLIREKLYNKVTKDVKVSDDDAKKYYDDHKQQYTQAAVPQSRDVRHILVKSKAKADAVYQQLKGGADFAKLAQKDSIDPSKSNGGKLTVCKQQSVSCLKTVPAFEKTAFALKANEISKPVHTKFGWHVIQALGPVKPPSKAKAIPFDQVKTAIKQQLLQEKKQQEMTKWWNGVKKDLGKKTSYQTGYKPPSTSTTQTTTTG